MKKHILRILFFGILFLFGIYYTYYLSPIVDDEFYNYGFSLSIINGLVPYRDFNMIVPYFSHLILCLFILVLGKKLIVYHVVINLIIVIYTYICYKKIGWGSLALYLISYIYPYTYYNMFSLLLLFILLFISDSEKCDKYVGLILGIMFLTKQTLGILMIPYIIYSKNKIKSLFSFMVPVLIFMILLIYHNSIYQFIDYCFLGMFDFSSKNNTGINFLFILELIIIIILILSLVRSNNKDVFYVLMFQIIVFPIVNLVHFTIGFIPVVYLLIKYILSKNKLFIYYLLVLTTSFMIFIFGFNRFNGSEFFHNYKKDGFMHNRYVGNYVDNYIVSSKYYITSYKDYDVYIFGFISYIVKLNLDLPINKYDIINNGNMGYNGVSRYIKEIDNNCKNSNCLFISISDELVKNSQVNKKILNHVDKKYHKIYGGSLINIYLTTEK